MSQRTSSLQGPLDLYESHYQAYIDSLKSAHVPLLQAQRPPILTPKPFDDHTVVKSVSRLNQDGNELFRQLQYDVQGLFAGYCDRV
ncbi:unnamed protein product [Toxocara canis]|uniref:Uncharacterized protein n=1 Tax=Toxocara canis TaxID=6265 RepID=A0A183U7B2_TOXCA|nr:unnamed protein product [Toxocara canis]